MGKQCQTLFFGAPKSLQMVIAAMKLNNACSLEKSYDQPRQHIKKQRHYFANECPSSQSYSFSRSHVWMWELDYKESWALKNWCFWTVVLEKTLESPLHCKEIQPLHPKGDQSWIFLPWVFTGRTDTETPILWPPDVKNWLIGNDPDAGKDWRQEEKGTTEDEMVRWHRRLGVPGSWWWTGKPGMLQSMGSQRVGHHWETELILILCLLNETTLRSIMNEIMLFLYYIESKIMGYFRIKANIYVYFK